MESNVARFEGQQCVCQSGGSLAVLKEVQKAYEQRLELVDRFGGYRKTEMQLQVLRQWVGDLVSQNALLARAVTELECEAAARLTGERARHQEASNQVGARRQLQAAVPTFRQTQRDMSMEVCGYKDMKVLSDNLQKENAAKDREIRKLNKDMSLYEQTIASLRSEISANRDTAKRDDVHKDGGISGSALVCVCVDAAKEECAVRLRGLELNLKSSSESLRALRRVNVALSEELHGLRRVCAALDDQCRAAHTRMRFKDDIIREMRRQLKQAKDKLKGTQPLELADGDKATPCVAQPRAQRRPDADARHDVNARRSLDADARRESDACRGPDSADDVGVTSSPLYRHD